MSESRLSASPACPSVKLCVSLHASISPPLFLRRSASKSVSISVFFFLFSFLPFCLTDFYFHYHYFFFSFFCSLASSFLPTIYDECVHLILISYTFLSPNYFLPIFVSLHLSSTFYEIQICLPFNASLTILSILSLPSAFPLFFILVSLYPCPPFMPSAPMFLPGRLTRRRCLTKSLMKCRRDAHLPVIINRITPLPRFPLFSLPPFSISSLPYTSLLLALCFINFTLLYIPL